MKSNEEKVKEITEFLKNKLTESGCKGYVLGLSGGIDSALTLVLSVMAVGSDNVKSFSLPSEINSRSTYDAIGLADFYRVQHEVYNIALVTNAYKERGYGLMPEDYFRLGNIMARTRMTILYDKAFLNKSLVLNTCNLSEDLVGYATKFGDGAGDVAPIAHLTKREVYELAEYVGILEVFINRVPSAELWSGQTDEGELGFKYDELDNIIDEFRKDSMFPLVFPAMHVWMEVNKNKIGVKSETWDKVMKMNKACQHKLSLIPSLVGEDYDN